jgi:hypothetical protein
MEQIQYVGNDKFRIKVDEVRRLCDGTYFVGQNNNLGRCFGVMNEKGDLWYVKHLGDDDIDLLTTLAEQLKHQGYWQIVCLICMDYDMND